MAFTIGVLEVKRTSRAQQHHRTKHMNPIENQKSHLTFSSFTLILFYLKQLTLTLKM